MKKISKFMDSLFFKSKKNRNNENTDELILDFPECLESQYPEIFNSIWSVVNEISKIVRKIDDDDLDRLSQYSPSLRGFNWENYVRLSAIRMAKVLSLILKSGITIESIVDYGSYFGNFSIMCARNGFSVDSVDSYKAYSMSLNQILDFLRNEVQQVYDFSDVGYDMHNVTKQYDCVLCLGVIEHIPHTPRVLMESIDRVLRKGGLLIIDTPNLAYIYNRDKLFNGKSIFAPIEQQYHTKIPYQGHHREYTIDEIRWIFDECGYENVNIDSFNYSIYGLDKISGNDLKFYNEMARDISCRELILASGVKGK